MQLVFMWFQYMVERIHQNYALQVNNVAYLYVLWTAVSLHHLQCFYTVGQALGRASGLYYQQYHPIGLFILVTRICWLWLQQRPCLTNVPSVVAKPLVWCDCFLSIRSLPTFSLFKVHCRTLDRYHTCDKVARQGSACQNCKCNRPYRTFRRGASHSRATRFRNRALLYSMRLCRASKTRNKIAGVTSVLCLLCVNSYSPLPPSSMI